MLQEEVGKAGVDANAAAALQVRGQSRATEGDQRVQARAHREVDHRHGDDEGTSLHQALQEMAEEPRRDALFLDDHGRPNHRREGLVHPLAFVVVPPGIFESLRPAEVQPGVDAGLEGGDRPGPAVSEIGGPAIVAAGRHQAHHQLEAAIAEVGPPLEPIVETLVVGRVRIEAHPRP